MNAAKKRKALEENLLQSACDMSSSFSNDLKYTAKMTLEWLQDLSPVTNQRPEDVSSKMFHIQSDVFL